MDGVVEKIVAIAFEESFGEIVDKLPQPPADATPYDRLYNYAYVFFVEGMRAGLDLMEI